MPRSRETDGREGTAGGREGCLIRLFVKLAGQLVAPAAGPAQAAPRASLSGWAPRELFSPRLARAIITDLIKTKSDAGHVGPARDRLKRVEGGIAPQLLCVNEGIPPRESCA